MPYELCRGGDHPDINDRNDEAFADTYNQATMHFL